MTRTEVAAAAPTWVRERLEGQRREVTVVHAGADAIYVDDAGRCLGLLSRSAVSVPCGLQTTMRELPIVPDRAYLGDGRMELNGTTVRVGRLVDATVPRLNICSTTAQALATASAGRLDPVRAELPASALRELRDAEPSCVPTLLGRGSGLTPVGDDVLCGWVATQHSISAPSVPMLRAIEANAAASTTMLSATLLSRACAGDVIPEFRRLLLALRSPTSSTAAICEAADALLAVGHTSGAGLLLGCSLALGDDPRPDVPAPSYSHDRRGR